MNKPKKVLIIDDEDDVVEILSTLLRDEGFETCTATNGQEGLRQAEKFQPDLIILDMNMPSMSGIDFYHKIYDQKLERPKYSVFVLTGRHLMEKVFDGLKIDGFFSKPFDVDELIHAVHRVTQDGKKPEVEFVDSEKHALIVDDNHSRAQQIAISFLDSDFSVETAYSAKLALEKVERKNFHLILIQLNLPNIKGDALALHLRSMPNLKDTAMIIYCEGPSGTDIVIGHENYRSLNIAAPLVTTNPQTLMRASEALIGKHRNN